MSDLVDLACLRELTEGDREMEQQLFDLFISSSSECITKLENTCTEGENNDWKKAAHAFKGSAVNLGAHSLAQKCAQAQEAFEATKEEKTNILNDIKQIFEQIKEFLGTV